MATPLRTSVFFCNKEMLSQCNGQNVEPVIVENLVIHFDQEKFEELLSRGSPARHARKHRKVSVAKAPVVTEQKSPKALTTACTGGRTLLQHPSVSTEARGISCEAQQVPGEPKATQTMQLWKAKQKALREALGKAAVQLRASREDKGKTPLNFGSITDASREADFEPQGHELLLFSPNLRALIPSANFAPMGEVKGVSLNTDSSANTAPVPKGTITVLSREAGTEALCSTRYLRNKAKNKAPRRAKSEVTMTLLPKFFGAKFMFGSKATSIASPSEANVTAQVIFKHLKLKAEASRLEVSNLDNLIQISSSL